jgi:hypothetical protein
MSVSMLTMPHAAGQWSVAEVSGILDWSKQEKIAMCLEAIQMLGAMFLWRVALSFMDPYILQNQLPHL